MFGSKTPNIFRKFKGKFQKPSDFWIKYSENIFKFYGGEVVVGENDSPTFYFCDPETFKESFIQNESSTFINYKFILDCKKKNAILDIKNYVLK